MAFVPTHLDYQLSPYTGMTRESWIEAAKYMLEGIFRHIPDMEHPVVVPRQETEITYPHYYSSKEFQQAERKAEIFEGLTRSFFIAAPLIHENPDTKVCGFHLRDYYKHQVLRTCTSGDEFCAGTYEELQEITKHVDTFRPFQQTVETCALVICLWACKENLWDTYSKAEKDVIAKFLSSFAHANTVPQNWRLFNMLDMAFLYNEGYPIDEEIMLDHAQAILEYYAGDGWYRDGQCFDYYSCWAFNFYAPLWNQWYGYKHLPYIAEKFEENSNKLMESYGDFFDRDGFVNMWGRSNIYRFAAVCPFDGNYLLKNPAVNPGEARRVSSGALLQFLTREDFLWNGIPSMGFYGQFSPLVQGYSCAESPFWLGKAFLCLHLPAGHPFWTAKESEGTWGKLEKGEVKETVLDGPALCFTNHEANGGTILRTGKVVKKQNDYHGLWNYSKLSYHTKYPWESTPDMKVVLGRTDLKAKEVESQQYVLKDIKGDYISLCNITYWCGVKNGVLYRKQFFDYRTDVETHFMQGMFLADFPVEYGMIRVDKVKLFRRPVILTLGSYGFPDNEEKGTQIRKLEKDGAKAIVLKGYDSRGKEKQMAMTVYAGFKELGCISSEGTNPDSKKSLVLYGSVDLQKQYGGHEPYVFISQVITKESHEDFLEEEIFAIQRIAYTDRKQCGTYGDIQIVLKNGTQKRIDYNAMEGKLSI